MKKLLTILITLLLSFSLFAPISYGACTYNDSASISENLKNCLGGTALVQGEDLSVTGGFRDYITRWTNNIALYLGVLAVFGIALGSLMLVISTGEEDKTSKAKTIIKWSIIGFVAVVTAALIVNLVVRIMYSSTLTSIGTSILGG